MSGKALQILGVAPIELVRKHHENQPSARQSVFVWLSDDNTLSQYLLQVSFRPRIRRACSACRSASGGGGGGVVLVVDLCVVVVFFLLSNLGLYLGML